jgi:hypothetical protein
MARVSRDVRMKGKPPSSRTRQAPLVLGAAALPSSARDCTGSSNPRRESGAFFGKWGCLDGCGRKVEVALPAGRQHGAATKTTGYEMTVCMKASIPCVFFVA